MPENMKTGLVLSGGGAKGAYQVGVLKALKELGIHIDLVAGASIGALNAAVLASAPSPTVAVDRLETLWLTLAESSPLSVKSSAYLNLLASAGLQLNGLPYLKTIFARVKDEIHKFGVKLPNVPFLDAIDVMDNGVLCDQRLRELMAEYLNLDGLSKGLPLYVSVFKTRDPVAELFQGGLAELGICDTAKSEFLHIQSLPKEVQIDALLASAALPFLFAARQVNGSMYSDGGQGGWQKMQGNTPITPLLQAGCKMVIVTHLSDASLWSRQDFPDATILEVRPQTYIRRDEGIFGGAKDLLGFDQSKIPSWIDQGYKDTLHCVGRVMKASASRNELRYSEKVLENSEKRNAVSDSILADAITKLI
jgi:NTE family protein